MSPWGRTADPWRTASDGTCTTFGRWCKELHLLDVVCKFRKPENMLDPKMSKGQFTQNRKYVGSQRWNLDKAAMETIMRHAGDICDSMLGHTRH